MRYSWMIPSLLLLTGCCKSIITVRTEYLNHQNLASYYVDTPDPKRNCPTIGQRLILKWIVPPCYIDAEDLHLELTLRYGNKKEKVQRVEVCNGKGNYIMCLLDSEFEEFGGIQTYKVDLIGDGEILVEWRHQLWTNLIIFQPQPEETDKDE